MEMKITVSTNSMPPRPPMTCDNTYQVVEFCNRQSEIFFNAVIKFEGDTPQEEKTAYLNVCKVLKKIPNLSF